MQEMPQFLYEDLVKKFKLMKNRRLAGFVQLYYIERKSQEEIMERMFINNRRTYYKMKQKVKKHVTDWSKDFSFCNK